LNGRIDNRKISAAERVVRMGVLQFHHRAQISGNEFPHLLAILPGHDIELGKALRFSLDVVHEIKTGCHST
jgi:hypothetical protein